MVRPVVGVAGGLADDGDDEAVVADQGGGPGWGAVLGFHLLDAQPDALGVEGDASRSVIMISSDDYDRLCDSAYRNPLVSELGDNLELAPKSADAGTHRGQLGRSRSPLSMRNTRDCESLTGWRGPFG